VTAPTLGLAVSGGPDSLALLLIASAKEPVRVATVDHGLRPEARAEAEHVAAICAERGIPHDILSLALPPGSGQAKAREARYAALGAWCVTNGLTRLATGHHADDQAETVLMRLARGAGLSGLAGVRARRPLYNGVILERPLLARRKAELEALVAEAALTPVHDSSNEDSRFDRTGMRALLASTNVFDPARVAHSAAHLAEAEAALCWVTKRLAGERINGNTLDPRGLPVEILRRLVLRMFKEEPLRGPELARMIAALQGGGTVTLGSLKVTPGLVWTFTPAPPRRGDQTDREPAIVG